MEINSNFTDQPNPIRPNNNLPLAIVSTVLGCCSPMLLGLIVGIVSIVFSAQVNSKFAAGDQIGAEKSAKISRILSYIALGLLVANIIYLILNRDVFMQQYNEMMIKMNEAQGK